MPGTSTPALVWPRSRFPAGAIDARIGVQAAEPADAHLRRL